MSSSLPRRRLSVRGLLPHLGWEAVLLLAVLAVAVTLGASHTDAYSHGTLWPLLAWTGPVASGLALSFRTATPNLAVGLISTMSGWVCVNLVVGGMSLVPAAIVGVLLALGVGAVLGVIVGLSSMPAWAVTLVAGLVVQGALMAGSDAANLKTIPGGVSKDTDFIVWAALFAVVSVGGGVLFAVVPGLRALLSANRPDADGVPGRWRATRLLGALVGLAGSSAAAGFGGVLLVAWERVGQPSDTGLLPYAVAAVLLGGVSVFGRRAGVFGVLLGVTLIGLVRLWEILDGAGSGIITLTFGLFALVGIGVNRLLEWLDPLVEGPPEAPRPTPVPPHQPLPQQPATPWSPAPPSLRPGS